MNFKKNYSYKQNYEKFLIFISTLLIVLLSVVLFYASFSKAMPYEVIYSGNDYTLQNTTPYHVDIFLKDKNKKTLYFTEYSNKKVFNLDLTAEYLIVPSNNQIITQRVLSKSNFFHQIVLYLEDKAIGELMLIDSSLPELIINSNLSSEDAGINDLTFVTSVAYKTTRSFNQTGKYFVNRTKSLPYLFQNEPNFMSKAYVISQYLLSTIKLINGTEAYHEGVIIVHDINGYPEKIVKSTSKSKLILSKDSEEYGLLINPSLELPRNKLLILDSNLSYLDSVSIIPDYQSTDGHYIYLDSDIIRIDGYRTIEDITSYVIQEFSRNNLEKPLWEFDSTDFYGISDSFTYPKCEITFECIDYVHGNSHKPYKKENQYLLSFRHLNSIINYDASTNQIVWSLGNDKYNPLIPEKESDILTFSGQHDPSITDSGSLILFDNGTFENRDARIIEIEILDKLKTYKVKDIVSLGDVSLSGGWVDKVEDYFLTTLSDPKNLEPKFLIIKNKNILYELSVINSFADAKLVFSTNIYKK